MRLNLFALLLCVGCGTVFAQTNDTTSRIDRLFSSWNNATPGGSILVARGNSVLYHRSFGLADLERNVPNTTETLFEAGSVSKQFTAYSILLLQNEGKLSVTDDVRKYIPELPVYEAPITIQHLLNHTSGLKDWGSVAAIGGWQRGTKVYTLKIALDIIFHQKTTNFKPGEMYSYSNSNYTLLVAIVERVSKQTLEDFTTERIFKPLGMTNTRWRTNFRDIIPNRAQAYSYSVKEEVFELEMPFEHVHGHAGLLTTTGDLFKWSGLLEKHDAVYNERIKNGTLNDGSKIAYAAGIQHGNVNDVAEIGHSGATAGYRAWLAYYPAKKLTVAFLSNDGSAAPAVLGRKVAEVYFGKPKPSPDMEFEPDEEKPYYYDLNTLGTFAGEYYSEDAQCIVKIALEGEVLVWIDASLEAKMIEPADTADTFTLGGTKINFKRDKKGVLIGMYVSVSRAGNVPFTKIKK